jgi:pyruvate dehydrogenase E2 component (dihydrolipoamide acetyltransferase)
VAVPLPAVRIGIAVDSPDGLLVVAVDDPDAVPPAEADRSVREAIERARGGKVLPTDLKDVSSSISSLGSLGVDRFNALLVPPQPTILSVGRIVDTPVVVDGRVGIRPMMEVGLTVDHRVADGADAARLLDTFVQRLGG